MAVVYVGTRASTLHVLRLSTAEGTLSHAPTLDVSNLQCPSALLLHGEPPRRRLYAAVRVPTERRPPATGSAVQAFAVGEGGELSLLNRVGTGSVSPCHLAMCEGDSGAGAVLAAHFAAGTTVSIPMGFDGSLMLPSPPVALGAPWWDMTTLPPGADPEDEQRDAAYLLGPHAHCVAVEPTVGRYCVVTDYGRSQLHVYELDSNARLQPLSGGSDPFESGRGSGPRHCVFHPSGEWLFVVNADSCTVESLHFDLRAGTLTSVSRLSTLPAGSTPASQQANSAPCLVLSNSCQFLFVGNHGHNSIATVAVDDTSGNLTARRHTSIGDVAVDALALTDDDRWLLVCNTVPGSVRALAVDPNTGALSPAWGRPGFGASSVVEGLLGASSIVIASNRGVPRL